MNISYEKVLLITKKFSRGHRILNKLLMEFQMASGCSEIVFNRKSSYEYHQTNIEQKNIEFKNNCQDLLQLSLYAENQKQLNSCFSWISKFEFFNNEICSFYLSSDNFKERFNNSNIFQVKPFNPPILPNRFDKNAKKVSLVTIGIDFLKHVYAQEKLFRENVIAGK